MKILKNQVRENTHSVRRIRKGGRRMKKSQKSFQESPRFSITGPLSFSDQIAFDQFVLAIERNFLLHITAGLNLIVVGLAMFRFFSRNPSDLYVSIGIGAFGISFLVMGKGTADFLRMRRDLALMKTMIKDHRSSSGTFSNAG
ncbi:MAG: DUF202 domain-containing protein [Nitrospiraceae bacterium]|nr:DUF202 domain-containing protein [Nitrospiraceae bacterium]